MAKRAKRQPLNPNWPVLKTYTGAHLRRIALPLGGIGTGTVSLGGRGDLRDWEIMNRPAKGYTPDRAFFALWAQAEGQEPVTRCLEGPVDPVDYEGASGCAVPNHGLPRFRECAFHAAYPLAQIAFADPEVPVRVRLEAMNPLVPADADASGIPAAVLRYVVTNPTRRPVAVSICGTVPNLIGADGSAGAPNRNVNRIRQASVLPGAASSCAEMGTRLEAAPTSIERSRARSAEGREAQLRGIAMSSQGVCPEALQWGTMALAVLGEGEVTYREAWHAEGWNTDLLAFWDDFSADGRLERGKGAFTPGLTPPADAFLRGSLALRCDLQPGETRALTFLITWHFPNRGGWDMRMGPDGSAPPRDEIVGNYYATRYRDAWDVAARTAAALPELERRTVAFVQAVVGSDLPEAVKDAALSNLSTLRTQTCFRTADGYLFAWEGCHDRMGCCPGSCTHVWNYEQATAFLFGDLAWGMREVEFLHATNDQGLMAFRVGLPLGKRAQEFGLAAADGQMGCLLKLYRDWQLRGDDDGLRALWPHARRALEFCWIPGGWDADQDGVMEGCQHNTMDVEYYGPNPQMGIWYLGALRAAEEMARYLGEEAFADRCQALFASGSAWVDANLFNGEYYEHEVRPLRADQIAPGLRHPSMGAANLSDPDFQLGAGCLVDQLVGQFLAHVCGLGYLTDRKHVRRTLRSIMRHNFISDLSGHFNHMRSYALGRESALLMSTYPRGRRPRKPFPYATEVMTGFEYTAAIGMLYEGQTKAGLKCIQAIRDRYDGLRRSPFDEAECGHHYGRAMASWAAILALTGFHYSAVTGTMSFAPVEGRHFWSTGYAWGTCRLKRAKQGWKATVEVIEGELALERLVLTGCDEPVQVAVRHV
ncbi:MAG: hypothetical protein HPY69_14400 [Armatimonadetes bacterium]|nr:hypothetical protein [Armatimonadota bacterium]